MHKEERKRLEKLQKESDKEPGVFSSLEKLTLSDLLLLLRHDSEVRDLIRQIAAQPMANESETEDEAKNGDQPTMPDSKIRETITSPPLPASDPLRQQLAPELRLLAEVQADLELKADWLKDCDDGEEGRQLVRLLAQVAQWDVITDLWERLANRCKQEQRPADVRELQILKAALAVHNLRWQGRFATLREVNSGTAFDFQLHQRATSTGEIVCTQFLPGLVNAGGELQKKPLVKT